MTEIYANELSFSEKNINDYNRIHILGAVYTELKKYGITCCRISIEEYNCMLKHISSLHSGKNIFDFVYSFFHTPYEESSIVEKHSEEYLLDDWKYNEEVCIGLPLAYITDSATLSLDDERWSCWVNICRNGTTLAVRNFANTEHTKAHTEWLESLIPPELIISNLSPHEKKVNLRDDHGKDKLSEFAKKIIRSPYVIGIVNSLPFNSNDSRFIRKIEKNGLIECVLYWYDKGYGMVIKTTGRNLKETREIAEILNREYGKRRGKS